MTNPPAPSEQALEIDLRDPPLAALLAWLWPGMGHIYQRRYAKGLLFMVCILGTYFFGLALGEGKVVYANWTPEEHRWQFALQVGVGLPAAPAIVQWVAVRNWREPIGGYFMAPPKATPRFGRMPAEEVSNSLPAWHQRLNLRFELGTLYTMVAGLLNVLAIYDAAAGPALSEPVNDPKRPPGDGDDKKK